MNARSLVAVLCCALSGCAATLAQSCISLGDAILEIDQPVAKTEAQIEALHAACDPLLSEVRP